ncbi:MAG: DeoR/GlpR transcriptional regulator [Rhodobacteraceae bacterium]|nr:DeoR/GlpR transcriptional regulator [Paracoccaceae bacterium]
MRGSRNTQARQQAILKHLKQTGRALVDDLANLLGATPQTIRKDLTSLADNNQIIRFHGGAALVAGTEYTNFDARAEISREEKDAIGRLVAAEIPNFASVILNGGTTTAAAAAHLDFHSGLKVVTDSVYLANILRRNIGVEVMVPGGIVRASDGAILGESAVDFIRQFRADIAVIGAAAIAPDGALMDYDLREASVTRAIIASARNVVLAADSSKFGRMAPVCFARLDQIDSLATDPDCPDALRTLCDDNGVRLLP